MGQIEKSSTKSSKNENEQFQPFKHKIVVEKWYLLYQTNFLQKFENSRKIGSAKSYYILVCQGQKKLNYLSCENFLKKSEDSLYFYHKSSCL